MFKSIGALGHICPLAAFQPILFQHISQMIKTISYLIHRDNHSNKVQSLLQLLLGEGREDEAGSVDLGVVVAALLSLLLRSPAAKWLLDVGVGVLGADHEADLAGGVG